MTGVFWRDKNVLVTGCTGFLGSWLCRELAGLGARVTGVVRDRVPHSMLFREQIHGDMNIVQGSVEDVETLERALAEYEADTVFHLAAQAIVGIANSNPLSTFESNIKGAWCLLEACRRAPAVKRIVVASSDKAYGSQANLPYTEDAPLIGRHPYDVSKSCADLLCRAYYETYGLPVSVTRCGNFFGGGDLNFNRLVPGTIKTLLSGEAPVIRSDGTYIRDYLYVKDGVRAYLLLAEKMAEPGVVGEAFNFSNEIRLTVKQVTELIAGLMGKGHIGPIILNQAGNEIKSQFLSAGKARRVLGWAPGWKLEEALLETIAWYRDYLASK
ncbi:MAG: NAD-dependent epimerase/dehydratase family protein [Bacillota bacterium]